VNKLDESSGINDLINVFENYVQINAQQRLKVVF